MFSVVIPVWNEAVWLPRLLRQLSEQDLVTEVVVADNASTDSSASLARAAGCHVVEGGRPGTARNAGATAARENLIIFIDADAVLPRGLFERLAQIFADPAVAAVHFPLVPATKSWSVRTSYRIMYLYLTALDHIGIAQGVGSLIGVRTEPFHHVGGFDVQVLAGEDADFLRRIQKVGSVVFDRSLQVGVSARRFELESPWLYSAKTVMWALLRLLHVRLSIRPYTWKIYPARLAEDDVQRLIGLETELTSRQSKDQTEA